MKRKHFIIALMAMLSCFAFTAKAQVAKVGNTEYATIDEAVAAWTNNTTLTLLSNVTLSDVVTLNSTEHHILNLGTYTMTAASGKNAIEILPMGVGTAAKSCLTINAASVNPGGITTSKSCVSYSKTNGIDDRLMVTINGGVFNGSISSSSNNGGQACPYFVFNGGVFNKSVNLTKAMLKVTGGVFHSMFSCTGDQTAYRLISGGRFKYWTWMTADTNQKFAVGSSKGTYDVGVYVDDEGYLCVGGPVITELSPKYKAKAKSNTKWSSYLKYSSAATYGLYYTSVEKAGTGATVYEHVEAAKELDNNEAVKNFTPELPSEVKTFEVEAIDIEATAEATTKVTFNVEPKNASGAKVSNPSAAITFRLPVPAAWSGKANVYHEGTLLGAYDIKEESGAKYVEVSSANFSEFAVEAIFAAQVGETPYASFAEAAAAAQAGSEIKLLANIDGDITVPANVTLNGNGKTISGGIFAEGDITFAGVTTAADFDANVANTAINIPAGASLQLTGSARLVIGHGATFNITGTIEDAKTADKATLVPSLKIAAGASITGNGVTFNVNNAYIVSNANTTSKNNNANGTLDFNINNSIWEQTGVLAFYVPTSGKDPVVNFELKNSVLTTTSHLVFSVTKGEIVFDNSLVNQGTSRQIENRSTMTIKNGSVVNGAVATSSNAINPGTIIVDNATYAVTGEFSGAAEGTGTLVIKKGANVSVGSIKAGANVTVDAEGMAAGDEINFTANLSQFTGTLSVINNDKLEASFVNGKVVLAAKPVAKIGEQGYATLEAAFAAATEGQTITMLDDATPALTSQRAITKAAVIDLGGKTMTLTEDDLYFGTTTFKNGTIVVDPSVKPSTAVFWMFAKQTLTFDNVKIVATGVTGTYLIGLEGENSDLNLLNGSEILVENTTALDLDIICVNGTNTCDIKVENSKVNVTNIDGRVFFRGNYTVKDSEVNLAGITKAGFRIEAGQTLSIEGTSKVNIEGEPRDGGIHMTDLSATYTKAETATVNATVNEPKVAKVGENTYRTLAQAVAAVEDGGTITLIANETFTKNNRYNNGGYWDGLGYSGDKSFTIDLANFTISQNGALNDYLMWFKNDGAKANTITLKNGTLDAGTTAYCALATASSNAQKITVNLENINVINNKNNGSTVKVRGGAELNVKAGTEITGKNSYLGIECVASTVNIYDGAKIYMNGTSSYNGCLVGACAAGTVNVYGGYGKGAKGGFIAMTSGGTINIEGGEWIANNDGTVGNNSNLYVLTAQSNKNESGFAGPSIINVTGGTFRGGMDAWVLNNHADEKAELNISGGNFNANPASYVAENSIATENNGVWTVAKAAAKVGNKLYASLEAAFKAATEGCTIEILSDVTVDYKWDARYTGAKFTVPVTINGNGKTIKFTASVNDNNYQAPFRFEADATVKNLTIDMSEVTDNRFRAISSKGNLTVDGCKFIGKDETLNCRAIIFGEGAGANVGNLAISITNSEFINWKRGITDNENAQDVKTVTITGNTLTDAGVGVSAKETVTFTGNTVAGAYVNIKSYTAGNSLNVVATDNTLEENTETAYNVINAGGTINAQEGFNASLVAKIGEATYYGSLQVAVNAVKNGETITLTSDVTENVTLAEKVGLYYTIDGADKTMNGTITITPLSDTEDNRRITIKNINFVDTADANVDFISSVNTNHYPRLTIEGCTFTGSGNDGDVAVRLKSSHSVVIKDCTATGLHSFIQNTSGWNLTIENVTVTGSKSGFALGTVQGVTVKGATVDVAGYGIRLDAQYNNNAVIESNKIEAFIPVVVRKAQVESNITVQGTNEMTATNTDGLWMAVGTSEYEENGKMPTAATAQVKVALTDTGLDAAGIYGSYYDALTIHVGATQTGRMVTRDVYVATMDKAVAEAKAISAGAVIYKVYGEVELTTGGSHGILDLGKNVVIEGADATAKLTIVGGGVPDIKGVTFKNIILADEGTYLPTANEFMYQNYIDCTFENVTFVDGIRLSGTSSIKDSKVDANTTNEYAIWLDEGEFTMTGTTVVGGADAYGLVKSDAVSKITISGNTFQYLSEANKEALNVKGAVIIAENNKFIDCVKGILPADKTNYTDDSKTTAATDATIAPNNAVTVNYAAIGEQKYETLLEAINAVQEGETIELVRDVTMSYGAREAFKTNASKVVINGNGKTLTLNQTNSDWSSFGLANNSKLVLNNMTIEKTGYGDTNGAWNTHAIIFSCPVEMNGVTVNNSVAVQAGAALANVTINEANGYYGLWINGNGQTVTVNGGAINATNGGRGIKIADEYIDAPAQVTLSVDGTVFSTAKKSAVLVSSTAGAKIAATNVNIANVAEDSENFVWVDEDWAQHFGNVEVTGATVRAESAATFTAAITANGAVQAYYKTLAEAINAAQAGATVELLADVTLAGGYADAAEGLRIEKEITLNGNGYTINCGNFLKGIRVYNPSNVSDFNVNFENVKVVNNVANGRCIDTRSGNINLKVNSSTLIATNGNSQPLTIGGNDPVHRVSLNKTTINAGASGYAVISFVSTNVDINGANNSTISGFAAFYLKGDAKTTNLNLGQGIYTGTNNHAVESGVFGTIVLEGDNNVVNLMGTNATVKAVAENTAPQAAFLVRGANNTIKITKESAKIITEGNAYEAMVDSGNAATTKFVDMGIERKLVAENRGYQFYSFEEAVRFAGNEGTIKVVNDFELAEAWTVAAGQNITLDLNGKTVTMVYNQKATKNHTMISNSGNLTIQSSVEGGKLSYTYAGENLGTTYSANTVTSNPGSVLTVKSGTIENLTYDSGIIAYAIDGLTNGGAGDVTVNIEGGVITSKRQALRIFANSTTNTGALNISGGDFTGRVIVQNANANANKAALNITGGTFNANEYKTDVLYLGGSQSATIDINATVSGGTFKGEITETHVTGFISGGTFVNPVAPEFCADGFMPNKNADGTYGVVVAKDVYASINGVTYGSLKAAVAAAKAGETITLLQDVKENVTIGKHLTIDGAGKTITGMITTDGKSLKVTIKNVNFNGNNKAIYYAVKADDDLNLVVENCSVDNYTYGFLYANKSNDKIVVKNVTVENCASYGAYLVSFNSATFENFTVRGAQYGVAVSNAGARKVSFKNVSFDVTGTPLHINETATGNITFNFSGINDMGKAEFYTSQYVKVVAAAQVGTKVCGSLQDAVDAANDGETVKVLSDFSMTTANFTTQVDGYATLVNVAGKAVTIDLNGKKVTVNAAHADLNGKAKLNMLMSVFHADPNGTLTLTDSSAEGTGTVELKANDAKVYGLIVSENAGDKTKSGKIVVNGGTYIADKVSDSMIFSDTNEVITVNGGSFRLGNIGTGDNGSPWIFNTSGRGLYHINVNGGTYNANIAKQYYRSEVNLGEGLTTTNNGNGTWTVVPAVATVGEETFGFIQEAIDAAQDGETVKLIADVTLDTKKYTTQVDNLVVLFNVKGKTVTFDLNGKKIEVNASAANLGGKMLAGVFSADLEGNFIITDSSAEGTGAVKVTVNDAKVYSIFLSENVGDKTKSGKMTVNAGNFTTVGKVANAMIFADTDKVVTINGGTFICDGVSVSENYPWLINTHDNNVKQVIVNGGTFNVDINHQYRPFEVFVPENLAVKNNGNGTWTIVPAQAYVTEMLGNYVNEPGNNEHKVGYATVAEAIAATNDLGKVVTLLADVDTTEVILINKSLTINGNSHKVASSATRVFRVTASNIEVTLNGVNMVSRTVMTYPNDIRGISIDPSLTGVQLTLKNSSVDFTDASACDWAYAVNVSGNGTGHTVTVNGGSYEGANVINVHGANNTIVVKDATLTSLYPNNDQYYGACIWVLQNQNSSVEATGNTFNGSNAIAFNLGTGTALTESENIDNTKMIVAKVDSEYYTSLAEAVAAADGNTVKILHSFDIDEPVTVTGNVTLDLNGKTITGTPAEAKAYAVITNKGTLTIYGNGTVLCDHKLAGSTSYAVNTITNLGTLTIENGVTVENKSTAQYQIGYAIDNNSTSADAVVNIKGGKVIASGSLYYDGIRQFCNSETKENSVVVSGGEVSTIWMQNPSDGADKNTKDVKGSIAISGGNVGVLSLEPSANFEAAVTGGHVGEISYFQTAAGRDLVEFVTGGTFDKKFDEAFLAMGYQLTGDATPYKAEYTGKREALTIVDGQYTEFVNEKEIEIGTLTYQRTLATVGQWQPLFVPFEIPVATLTAMGYEVAFFYDVHFKVLTGGEIDPASAPDVHLIKIKEGTLKANYPYVIRAKENAELTLVLNNVVLHTTDANAMNSVESGSTLNRFIFAGNYIRSNRAELTGDDNIPCYWITKSGAMKKMASTNYLGAFRVFMYIVAKDGSPVIMNDEVAGEIRMLVIGEENENGETIIYDVISTEQKSEKIFDLQGRRVLSPVKGNLYIINGKKVVY